jgi:hypothetical protein
MQKKARSRTASDFADDDIPTGTGIYASLEAFAEDYPPGTEEYEVAKQLFASGQGWIRFGRVTNPKDLN